MDTRAILSVDCGSTRVKAGYLDESGSFTVVASFPAPVSHPESGAAIQDPALIAQLCVDALARCAQMVADPQGLVLTGQMGGAIVVSRAAAPLSPWIINMDSRCRRAAAHLHQEVGARVRRLAASMPEQAQYLRWMVEDRLLPERDGLALLLAPYIATQLAVEGIEAGYCDRTCLGWSGLADVARVRWDAELVAAARWSESGLPPIVEPGSVVGHLAAQSARLTGLPSGLPIIAGPGDQAGSLYALGADTPGNVIDGATTFPLLMGVADHFFVPKHEQIEVMPGVGANVWHPLVFMVGTGAMPGWFAQEMAGVTLQEIDEQAEAAGSAGSVFVLPYGLPGAGRGMTAVIWGLDGSVQRGAVHYALLEGMAFEYALMAEALDGEGVTQRPPILSYGGGSASRLLNRLKAAVLARPLLPVGNFEATLAGAALCAAHAGGWAIQVELSHGDLVEADESTVAHYHARLTAYRRFRAAMLQAHQTLTAP